MSDEQLSKQFETYQELVKNDPNIDINTLMADAFNAHAATSSAKPKKSFHWQYLLSLGMPILGLVITAKYFMSDSEEERKAARICLVLTAIGFLFFSLLTKSIFSGSSTNLQNIQQLQFQDVQDLTQ